MDRQPSQEDTNLAPRVRTLVLFGIRRDSGDNLSAEARIVAFPMVVADVVPPAEAHDHEPSRPHPR
jgi:hypothetical protein